MKENGAPHGGEKRAIANHEAPQSNVITKRRISQASTSMSDFSSSIGLAHCFSGPLHCRLSPWDFTAVDEHQLQGFKQILASIRHPSIILRTLTNVAQRSHAPPCVEEAERLNVECSRSPTLCSPT